MTIANFVIKCYEYMLKAIKRSKNIGILVPTKNISVKHECENKKLRRRNQENTKTQTRKCKHATTKIGLGAYDIFLWWHQSFRIN